LAPDTAASGTFFDFGRQGPWDKHRSAQITLSVAMSSHYTYYS